MKISLIMILSVDGVVESQAILEASTHCSINRCFCQSSYILYSLLLSDADLYSFTCYMQNSRPKQAEDT